VAGARPVAVDGRAVAVPSTPYGLYERCRATGVLRRRPRWPVRPLRPLRTLPGGLGRPVPRASVARRYPA